MIGFQSGNLLELSPIGNPKYLKEVLKILQWRTYGASSNHDTFTFTLTNKLLWKSTFKSKVNLYGIRMNLMAQIFAQHTQTMTQWEIKIVIKDLLSESTRQWKLVSGNPINQCRSFIRTGTFKHPSSSHVWKIHFGHYYFSIRPLHWIISFFKINLIQDQLSFIFSSFIHNIISY